MFRRLVLEALEEKTLLAANLLGGGTSIDSPLVMTASVATSVAHGTVLLHGEGDVPAAGATGSDLDVLFETSRKIDGDFNSLTLCVAFNGNGLRTISTSEFNAETAGFQLGNIVSDAVPDLVVSDVLANNLISNGRYAVYLYSGGEDSFIQSDWFLRVVWFDFSLSGDWSQGAETVTDPLRLMSIHFNFDENQINQTQVKVDFSASCDEGWDVTAVPFRILISGKPSSDLIAEITGGDVTIQAGCSFFLSGANSYSTSGGEIVAWLWDLDGDGVADLEGKEVWIDANSVVTQNGAGTVGLVVEDALGRMSSSVSVSVTKTTVKSSVYSTQTDHGAGRILNVAFDYVSADGTPGAVWEIDWGDGSETERRDSLSFSLTAVHCYALISQSTVYRVTLRVTDANGATSPIFWVRDHYVTGQAVAAFLPEARIEPAIADAVWTPNDFAPLIPQTDDDDFDALFGVWN